jgi:spermidine/putrescine transport system ATP-binding protein
MSDRIAVMEGGVALQVGDANDIYEQPNCRFVADFIGDTNFLDGVIGALAPGKACVDVAGGVSLWAHTPQPVTLGQKVTVTVRPEKMHIRPTTTDATAANLLCGTVTDIIYIGTDTHYGVALDGGQAIRVREQNDSAGARLLAREGEKAGVWFSIEAARVLTE